MKSAKYVFAGSLAIVFCLTASRSQACEPELSVLRQGREGLVRCSFSADEDMVVQVRDLVNEWVYLVPRALPTRDFAKGELVHAGPDDFPATQLGDFGFMSGNHGSYFAHLQTVKGHGFTSEAVGSVVTHESGERFVIVGVPDGDHLVLHPEGRPGEDPGFKYVPTGRFTAGEKTWEPSATSREQLWPMSRYRGFRWQLADGSEAPDGREARSSRIDLVLEHDVLDPRGVLAYLKAHPGTSGRTFGTVKAYALVDTAESAGADADFMMIPTLMTVRTTYRYDGRCCRQALRKTTYTAPIRSASVLDVCYCWNQGDGKWDDVRLYIPRLKPVTLKGKDGSPDVRCDFTSVEKMSYPPWCVNTHLTREDSTDPANPPDRFIRRLSRGDRQLGVALGYSLLNGVSALGNGWPNRETIYHFWDTGKMYPYVMNLHHVPVGTTYEHCAYTQFFDPRQEPDATAFYCHREGDALVVYMDFHKTLKGKRIVLPAETAGRGFEVLEKTPSVTLRVDKVATDGSVVLDVADGYGTLVLKIPVETTAISALIDAALLDKTVKKGETFPVWPKDRVPDRRGETKWRCKDTDDSVRLTDVNEPELSFFRASGEGPRPAVVICPGGAYLHLAYLHEGVEVAEWLAQRGYSAFVLKYRCPDQRESAQRDVQRALSLVRANADKYGVDPNSIGVMGFSAGAHLSAWASVNHRQRSYEPVDGIDAVSCRPDFAVLVYPGLLLADGKDGSGNPLGLDEALVADERTPPTFILQAEDDPVRVENSLAYYLSLKSAHVRAEMHLYPDGGHGYGIRHSDASVSGWETLLEAWLRRFCSKMRTNEDIEGGTGK